MQLFENYDTVDTGHRLKINMPICSCSKRVGEFFVVGAKLHSQLMLLLLMLLFLLSQFLLLFLRCGCGAS